MNKAKQMRVLVCGDRDWDDEDRMRRVLSRTDNALIIQGEADGADIMAKNIGRSMGFDVEGHYANWTKHNKAGGPLRNVKMLERQPDVVLAFHNDIKKSKGTRHCINTAIKMGVRVKLITRFEEKWLSKPI